MTPRLILLTAAAVLLAGASYAQDTPAPAPADSLDFDSFGSADGKTVQTYATQKVAYLTPTKLISIGYELQGPFSIESAGPHRAGAASTELNQDVDRYRGLRLGVNFPVISRSSFILNLGLTYWGTGTRINGAASSELFTALNRGLRTTGVNGTVFKPFDDVHFMILQANADLSGNYRGFDDLDSKQLTYSGTAIYGWKRSDQLMYGLGVTRTYRAGQLLHIPVLFYNRTYSPKWGVEAIFPARVNLRRNFGTSSLLQLGYELEGNAYYLGQTTGGNEMYLRRGEMKPRITYERQLSGFWWVSAQLGYRYNWRYNVFTDQNPKGDNSPLFDNTLGNPVYFNISVNLVSP